jgi:hypothetical protein
MPPLSDADRENVLVPIFSLITKSEKAQQKLSPGTWQHSMLRDNLQALRIAHSLLHSGDLEVSDLSLEELQSALGALASVIQRSEEALTKFAPGTSQNSLLTNRIRALNVAASLIRARLD